MNKAFKLALLLCAACTLGFSSCSDNDDPENPQERIEQQNTAIRQLTTNYLTTVVYNTYSNLATESEGLYNKINALKTKLNAGSAVQKSEIDAICQSYKDARRHWEESEAFLYGAATDFDIDPHIDTWPLDVETLAKDLQDDAKIQRLNANDGIDYARTSLTKENLGFHGIEFIFFRDGKNRSADFFNNDATEDYENYFKGLNVTAKEEVIFATAVAGDLRDKCFQLEVAWLGNSAPAGHRSRVAECAQKFDDFETKVSKNGLSYGEDMLATGTSEGTINSWKKVMETILVSGCSNICAEVADQKMGQAYRAAIGRPEMHEDEDTGEMVEDDPNYIESPYSHNSFTDFYDNIISIKNSLYGNRDGLVPAASSIISYLNTYNAQMSTELQAKLNAALSALKECQNSGKAFVEDPGAAYVKTAMDAVTDLDDYLNETSAWILKN
ncbi:MAG: imelysin [Bacteroidaceae bacterium]|nr:imelysin [Bacteroidaceae bacterium]